ncbi:MAG: SDR family oxidoreductase [Acidobacteria bacterium]|nr:SDR family oxidoreductase [Acidobacteriota bacterium]
MFRLDEDIAIVTGATGKLGPVWVEALLEAGARVAAWDLAGVQPSPGFNALEQRADRGRMIRIDCDVTSRAGIEAALRQVTTAWGTPTVLVNNAGIDQPPDSGKGRFTAEDLPIEMMRRMVEVNIIGALQMIQTVGGAMLAAGHGSIINVGSLYASVANDQRFYDHFPGDPPFIKVPSYGASKAGVVSLTKYFATLWGTRGIRVNTLSPGGVLGGQDDQFKKKFCSRVPLGRMAVSEDLKGPLVFLASSASSYVTGAELRVDGGFTAW